MSWITDSSGSEGGIAFLNENSYHYCQSFGDCDAFRLLVLLTLLPGIVLAADPEFVLTIRDHRFEPTELRVPAGKKIKLVIDNQDATPEEFESHELNREKVIPGKSRSFIYIGPLRAGRYPYFGDFNKKTATGVIISE